MSAASRYELDQELFDEPIPPNPFDLAPAKLSTSECAVALFDGGWRPFRMDPGEKFPPPTSVTGYAGRDRSRAQASAIEDGANLAVRVTADVVGIDVDAYHGGDETLAALIDELGPLPLTWSTHSNRGDGSCIRFFRIPPGTSLVTALPGIEMIQWFHRYAMVAPSVHPEGRPYSWFDEADDEAVEVAPPVEDLPELPWAWIDHLGRTSTGERAADVTPAEASGFFTEHTEGSFVRRLKGVRRYMDKCRTDGVSRHDTMMRATKMAFVEVAAGNYSASDAEEVLAGWWAEVFDPDLPNGPSDPKDRRQPGDGEFGRLILHGIGYATANPDEVDEKRPTGTPGSSDEEGSTPASGKAPPARDVIVDLAEVHYAIGRLEDERAYVVPHDGPNIALLSGAAKADLARRYRSTTGKTVGRNPLDEAWLTIEGIAHEAAKVTLPLRVGATDNGSPVVDLGDPEGRAVVVTAEGWAVVDRSPITFRRSKAMLPLDEPKRGGHIDEMFTLLNVDPGNRALFAAWLTSSLFEGLPHPAPVLRGEQGAAKSSTARAMTQLVDPCMAATQKPPRTDDDWAQTCSARWMVAVDNVSNVSEWWSDALCRTITGDGWLRRQLYTDDDVVATTWRRCVILNGITLGATLRPDLAERLVLFELHRPTDWLTEREVDDRLGEMGPRVFGALLDAAVSVLRVRPDVEVVRDLRMADFATFLAAHDRATGLDALASYREQLDNVFDEALESDAVAMAVIELMEKHDRWEGTARHLLAALCEPTGGAPADWPANARQLSNSMSRSSAMLRKVGIEWSVGRRMKAGRLCSLSTVDDGHSVSDEGCQGVVGAQDSPLLHRGVVEEGRAS